MIFLISERLFLNLCYPPYRLEESRVFRDLCTFSKEIEMFFEMFGKGEVADVSQ